MLSDRQLYLLRIAALARMTVASVSECKELMEILAALEGLPDQTHRL